MNIGTYCTTTSVLLMMPGVSSSATNMTTLTTKAIEQAENEINKFLSKRYDLTATYFQTSTSVPPIVRSWAEKLATANLWEFLSRGGAGKESLQRAKDIRKEIVGTEKEPGNLMMVAQYQLDLYDTSGSIIAGSANESQRVLCNTSGYSTTFDEDDEKSWAVDPDKLEDIADGRE